MGMLCDTYDANKFSPWPTCDMHYYMVTGYKDIATWMWQAEGKPHGPVHDWIAGVFNCDETMATISALIGPEDADALHLFGNEWRKTLWINGHLSCEGTATADQTAEEVRKADAIPRKSDAQSGESYAMYFNTI